jgi:methylase of polypeptide subunit release factors
MDIDDYVNKAVPFKFNGVELRFDLSHALFSSFDIDLGTRLLLKAVARDEVLAKARRILDEGCGVGVIGLCAAKAFPEAEVVLRDRDSLAVAFAERNRLANKLRGTTAWKDPATGAERLARPAPRVEWGLLGDRKENSRRGGDRKDNDRRGGEGSPETDGYDFVLSNLPAKAGAPVLASFFARLSAGLLAPGGRAGVVIVTPLAEAAEAWIAEAGLSVVSQARGSGHKVFVMERASGRAADAEPALGAYLRGETRFKLGEISFRAQGFWGLPEFDTPGYGSLVAAQAASRAFAKGSAPNDALFVNPGSGLVALWAARELGAKRITGASRDGLALAATGLNLAALPERLRPGYESVDALSAIDLPPLSFDLLVENPDIVPERDWIGPSWALAERLVRPGGVYLAFCSPTDATRLEKRRPTGALGGTGSVDCPKEGRARWSLASRQRKKGAVALAWRRE